MSQYEKKFSACYLGFSISSSAEVNMGKGRSWGNLIKNPKIEHEGQRLVFKLRKRSMRQRRRSLPHTPLNVPDKMQRKLLQEINVDLKELGFSSYKTVGGR